jgi:high-affinity iron transporter
MIATGLIAFREFLEAFLIIGVFFGISKKLHLKKELEIVGASSLGILISFLLASLTYLFGDSARSVLTERNADFLESYLMIFSGLFIAYVIFSLHDVLSKSKNGTLIKAQSKLQQNVFDVSLFFTIIFLVIREGFEIALFTASTSLFSTFMQNMYGLSLGFIFAIILGVATFFAYIKFSIKKIFRATEYLIIVLGAALTQNGLTELLESHFNIHLSNILSMPLKFLPDGESVAGHMLKSFFGIDREFSFAKLFVMILYIGIIYLIFLKKRNSRLSNKIA